MKSTRWLFLACTLCLLGCLGTSHESKIDLANWVEEDIAVNDVSVSLGYLDNAPVARITRGGNTAADVMVFCGFAESEEGELTDVEVATVYQPDSGLYVAEGLSSPATANKVVRFRMVLPDRQEPWIGHIAAP